jgi:zinc transporter 5/7
MATGSLLQHLLALTSATLILVGVIARTSSSLQPLDRRKEEKGTFNIGNAPRCMLRSMLAVLLPFYASLQLGGAKTAIVLLVAVAAGFGALDEMPGMHTPWDSLRRTLRTRKATSGALVLGVVADVLFARDTTNTLTGHGALWISILLIPPPLPTTGRSITTTSQNEDSYINRAQARVSSPKPSSLLVNSSENTLFTVASGLLLGGIALLCSLVSPSSSIPSPRTAGFFTLSIVSATALVYLSFPPALRSERNHGLKLGGLFIAAFSLWEHYQSGSHSIAFLWMCAISIGAVVFDTSSAASSTSHPQPHSHIGHRHSHNHEHPRHHLHGNHSRLSAFLIARTTPGSIIHSVLIEKDSRRIAYFGV